LLTRNCEALRSLKRGESSDTPRCPPLDGAPAYPPADIASKINFWSSPIHVAFNKYGSLGFGFFIH
jgi:hypothetical protein